MMRPWFIVALACLALCSVVVGRHRRFPYDFGCCRPVSCPEGFGNCKKLDGCSEGYYIRRCGACCDHCEKYKQEGEHCWKAMDLGFCRHGTCAPPLVCSTKGTCLPPDVGVDWGRGDEFSPFDED